MVSLSRVSINWWSLFWENGHLEHRMHHFRTLHSVSFVSRQKWARSNFNNILNFRQSECSSYVWVHKKVKERRLSFWAYNRNRAVDFDSRCSWGIFGFAEEDVGDGPKKENWRKIGFESPFFLLINRIEEIQKIFDQSNKWREGPFSSFSSI